MHQCHQRQMLGMPYPWARNVISKRSPESTVLVATETLWIPESLRKPRPSPPTRVLLLSISYWCIDFSKMAREQTQLEFPGVWETVDIYLLFLPTTFLIKLNSPCMASYKVHITYLHLQIFYSPVGKAIISWFCKMHIIYLTGQNGSRGTVLMVWLSA